GELIETFLLPLWEKVSPERWRMRGRKPSQPHPYARTAPGAGQPSSSSERPLLRPAPQATSSRKGRRMRKTSRRFRTLTPHHQGLEDRAQHGRQLGAGHDAVDHAALNLELGALEARRQALADGLLDHPAPGEADHGVWLGQ